MWVLIPIALFLLLSYVGRQARLGKLSPGPWFKQFRTVRSVIGMGLLVVGMALLTRGEIWAAVGCFVGWLALSGSVRFQVFGGGSQTPPTAASYSQDEIRAYQTLGLSIGASKKAVKDAWKQRMKTAHPDQGGDVKRASALNAARDILLKKRF